MKKIAFAILILSNLTALSAIAGAEDHMQNQVCYAIEISQGAYLPRTLPTEICFESLNVDFDKNQISIYSFFPMYSELFMNLKISYLARKNEDGYTFRSKGEFYSDWQSGCGEGESLSLLVSGQVDNYGSGNIAYQEISVEQAVTPDSCHSQPQLTRYYYKLR